jgi:hypothetical protein
MKTTVGSRRGFTIVELCVALVMMTVLGGLFFMTTETTSSAVRTGVAVAELDATALRALDQVCDTLKASSAGKATPQLLAPFSGTSVEFQRGLGADGAGAVQWGPIERFELEYAEADDGVDDDGDGLIDEGRLVWLENPGTPTERRIVVCEGVREYLEGEAFDGDDENDNGLIDERGFAIEFVGGRVTVRLTLEDRDSRGQRLVSTVERSIVFRNVGI